MAHRIERKKAVHKIGIDMDDWKLVRLGTFSDNARLMAIELMVFYEHHHYLRPY